MVITIRPVRLLPASNWGCRRNIAHSCYTRRNCRAARSRSVGSYSDYRGTGNRCGFFCTDVGSITYIGNACSGGNDNGAGLCRILRCCHWWKPADTANPRWCSVHTGSNVYYQSEIRPEGYATEDITASKTTWV